MEATVFNIQKFSLDDGPGIRTVVFLKGCPLRCAWCSNPESQRRTPQLEWDGRKCIGCGSCLASVPGSEATVGKRDGPEGPGTALRHLDVRKVDGDSPEAAAAVTACPSRALALCGKTMSVDEVLEECLKDRPFYEQSAGGVTLSGGEALLWAEFCIELLNRLHDEGIDTNMETTAFAPRETFDAVTEHLDHLYIDMKHGNAARHREGTGVDNALILENTVRAIASGLDVLVRTPVIPGFNDTEDGAREMARRLTCMGATRVQLLPFHNLGEAKYDRLGYGYALHGRQNLHPEDLEAFRQVYLDEGIEAFF